MDAVELERHLRSGDLLALVGALAPLSTAQRRALSPAVEALAPEPSRRYSDAAVGLAVLGCVTDLQQVTDGLGWRFVEPAHLDLAVRVLRDRRPRWLPHLPQALIGDRAADPFGYGLVRRLVRAGLVAAPENAGYYLAMAGGVDWVDRSGDASARRVLDDDPALLAHELWAMIEADRVGNALTDTDRWLGAVSPDRTWRDALVAMAAAGRIDRARLLDAALRICGSDRRPADTTWFVGLHDALAPDLAETAARQADHRRLLAAGPGPVVAMAQRALTRLLAAGLLDVPALVAASAAPLGRGDRTTVLAHLRLLRAAAPGHADEVAAAVRTALGHPRVDVQERALAVLTAILPDADRRAAVLREHRDDLAPTLRGGPDPVDEPAPPAPAPAARPVSPVVDADELAELLAGLVEEAADPLDVERALEGVARLARERPRTGAASLVRRAWRRLAPHLPEPWTGGEDVRADLAGLTLVWLDGARPGRLSTNLHGSDRSLAFLTCRRTHEVARAVAAGGAPTIGLPTHDDGSITFDAIVERLRALPADAPPLPLDVGVAALRLPPGPADRIGPVGEHRTARELAGHLAVLEAHAPRWEPVLGPCEMPYRPSTGTTWRDGAPTAATGAVGVVLDRGDPLARLVREAVEGEYATRFDQVTALWPLLLPHRPELLAAHAHARLSRALTRKRSGTGPLLDALGRSAQRTGPVVCSALALGLSARAADERIRAVDALDVLAARGLLDGAELGRQVRRLLDTGIGTGTRIAAALADAGRTGPATAGPLLGALVELLPGLPGRREAHLFVDLTAQVATRLGRTIDLPPPFAALRSSRSSSAIAAACRRVPG